MKRIEKYKLKNGETRYRFQIPLPRDPMSGKRRTTRRSGFLSREKAKLELNRLMAQLDRDGAIDPKEKYNELRTFGDVYKEWLVIYKRTVRPTTYSQTTSAVERNLLPQFSELRIDKIKAPVIQKAVNNYADKYMEFHRYTTVLRRVFKYAYKMGYTDNDEFDKVEIPEEKRNNHKLETDVLTKDQLDQYLRFIHNEYSFENYVYFMLLARTGMRRSEALALKWSDLKGRRLHIHRTLTKDYDNKTVVGDMPKTKGSDRVIILDDKTHNLLNQHHLRLNNYLTERGWSNTEDLMFVSVSKGHPQCHSSSWPYGSLRRLQKRYPQLKRIDVHAFRHTYATLALETGMTLLDLQHQLGHSNYGTTLKYYAKYTDNQKTKAAEKMQQFFDANDN
ncbi:site-specific integrase [Lactobacillus sp. Marseille-P7033]|nr:site-specific integrase [Lactobacillus sp. Marseille-P7033]NGC77161.1 site-specific integrase [Limosilactobacillus reuteri]